MKKLNDYEIINPERIRSELNLAVPNFLYVGNKVIAYKTPDIDDYTHYLLSMYKDLFMKISNNKYISLTDISRLNHFIDRSNWNFDNYKLLANTKLISAIYDVFDEDSKEEQTAVLELLPLNFFQLKSSMPLKEHLQFINDLNRFIYKNNKGKIRCDYSDSAVRTGIIQSSIDYLPLVIEDITTNEFGDNNAELYQNKIRSKK